MVSRLLLASGTEACASSGDGKFYLTGTYVEYVDLPMLKDYLQQMVKMSPLRGYSLEIVEERPETKVIGSAVSEEQAAGI